MKTKKSYLLIQNLQKNQIYIDMKTIHYEINQLRCPRCSKGNVLTDHKSGEKFCENCGFVMVQRSELTSSEGISIIKNEDKVSSARTGMPTSLTIPDMGLSTIIILSNISPSTIPVS
jgi:transcription initiation factor TFIIIB Brf1 subunit/transcription initiation factor TFIIB